MKWSPAQLESALRVGANKLPPMVLIFGDDSGAVRQASLRLLKHTGIDLQDPFTADRIDIDDLCETPAKLAESAGTISLLGGLRLIKIEGVTGDLPKNTLDKLKAAVAGCLELTLKDVFIIIPAPRLNNTHALVKMIQKSKQAAVLRLYQENIRNIHDHIAQTLKKEGKNISIDARNILAENLGMDKDITENELEKLIIYIGNKDNITADDVLACLADAPAANVFKLCDAVGNRDVKQAETLISLLMEEGEDPNMLFTMVIRHLRRLLEVQEKIKTGTDDNSAMRSLSPPVSFGQREFMQQVRKNPLRRLQMAAGRAVKIQYQTRNMSIPPELHFKRTILALAM